MMKYRALFSLLLASALSPLAMAQSTPPDSGLLITRVSSDQWEIRLIAGSAAQQFSGVMESDLPISGVAGVKLENPDSAKLLSPNSLGTSLAAWPGGFDGVNFSVSADAKLCLRDTGSSGVHIYLGDSLVDAIPVTAPLALTSADACGDVTAPVLAASGRKYHAGHYIVMGRGADTQALMDTALKPGVVGLIKRYTWRSLEPSQNVYQFAELKSDLAWATAHGMRLIVLIEDKTFSLERPNPAYLDSLTPRNRTGGYTVVRWSPTVVTRFNALVKAIGVQFDKNPNFEGIATQETALGLDSPVLKQFGYTPEKYRDAYINMLSAATVSLPTSRVFWLMNFLVGNQSYIGSIAAAVASKGVVMGGPDVWPDNKSLQSKVYPFYTQFQGKMPLFGQVENVCYSLPHMTKPAATKYWTMLELYNYAMTKLHVNYMFWVRVTKSVAYDWTDALKVIEAHPRLNP